jgi:hypothetical protein
MFFSDLVIHFYSTIALEASALDRPNISIGFDGRNGGNTVRQFEECFHLKPLIETGGVRIAKSGGDLISAVNGYLTQPEKDGEQRQKIVERFIGSNDGMATSRVAEMIHALVM